MTTNRKSLVCFLIFQLWINISIEVPLDFEEDKIEVDEYDIAQVIAEKEKQDRVKEENEDTGNVNQEFTKENKSITTKDKEGNVKDEQTLDTNQDMNSKQYNESIQLKIKQLESEKGELYKQINKAIDDSVLLLENTNDTEAKLGISYMKDLKQQIKEINGTGIKITSDVDDEDGDGDKRIERRFVHQQPNKIRLTYNKIPALFASKNKSTFYKKEDNIYIEMKKKIDDWLLQKRLEKQKILDYKMKMEEKEGKLEKCARFGYGKKKLKGKGRKQYLPCCRKCCKQSYMGCL